MIIGIDASRANRDHKSGVEWYSYYLIRWLAKLDKDNQYILYTDKPLKGGLLDLTTKQYHPDKENEKELYDAKGYQIVKSPFNNFKAKILKWPFKYLWTQGRMSLEMLCCRPDVLFVPGHTLPVIHPQKSIVTIHDVGFERERRLYQKEDMGPASAKSRKLLNIFVKIFTRGKYRADTIDYFRWSTEYAVKRAAKIITVSNFTKKELISYFGANPEKIKVIYNGYNKDLYKKIGDQDNINAVLEKYGLTRPYLLYVGRIERKKNIPALIEAFAILRQNNKDIKHKLILVGDASFGYDETKYMIHEFDLVDEVIMPGWLEELDLPFFFNGADAFVFPSVYEGFGIPPLQAIACGIPVAASNSSSIPEAVGEAALFFNPENPEEIAAVLKKIITDKSIRSQLAAAGAEHIKGFGWDKCAAETLREICSMN